MADLKIDGGRKEDIDGKLALEFEIRELLAYAHDMFGPDGLDHVSKQIAEFIPKIKSGEIEVCYEWVLECEDPFADEG